jgi:hypothetical protein
MKIKITYQRKEHYIGGHEYRICNSEILSFERKRKEYNTNDIENKTYTIIEVLIVFSPLFEKNISDSKENSTRDKIDQKKMLHIKKQPPQDDPVVGKKTKFGRNQDIYAYCIE